MFYCNPVALHVFFQLTSKLDTLMADATVVLLVAQLGVLAGVLGQSDLVSLQKMGCELDWPTGHFVLAQGAFFSWTVAPFLDHGGKVFRFHLDALVNDLESWNWILANTNAKIVCLIRLHGQAVGLQVVIDAGVGPGNEPGAPGNLALVLPDLLHAPVLLSIFT